MGGLFSKRPLELRGTLETHIDLVQGADSTALRETCGRGADLCLKLLRVRLRLVLVLGLAEAFCFLGMKLLSFSSCFECKPLPPIGLLRGL